MLEKSISCRTFGSKQRIKVSFIAFFLLFNHFFLSFNNYFVSSVNRNPNKHLQCTTHTMASFIVSVTTLYSPFSLAFSIYSLTRARAIYVSIASSIASMIHAILNRFLLSRAFFFVINYSNINMKIAPLHLHWLHFATAQLEADISIVSFEVAEVANRCVKCILIANRLFTSFNHTHASVPS